MHWDYLLWLVIGTAHGALLGWFAAKLHSLHLSLRGICPATSSECERKCSAGTPCKRLYEGPLALRVPPRRADHSA